MKRFKWPLQRLLDVTIQRENALRAELLALSRDIARVHQEIFRRQATLRAALADLSAEALRRRIPKQEVFMGCSKAAHAMLDQLKGRLGKLETRRTGTTERLVKARNSTKTLERLREEARRKHVREQLKIEQRALDESAQISYARDKIQTRIAGETGPRCGQPPPEAGRSLTC